MSLQKAAITVGGGSLQVYLKDGNNLHTEFIEEWILIEDQGLVANTNYFWRLSDRDFNIRLVSFFALTSGTIALRVQSRNTDLFAFSITNTVAASGYIFPTFILPAKYDLIVTPTATVAKLFMTAKEVSICENLTLSRS